MVHSPRPVLRRPTLGHGSVTQLTDAWIQSFEKQFLLAQDEHPRTDPSEGQGHVLLSGPGRRAAHSAELTGAKGGGASCDGRGPSSSPSACAGCPPSDTASQPTLSSSLSVKQAMSEHGCRELHSGHSGKVWSSPAASEK